MSGRYMTPVDISAAKHEMEIFNSQCKRGEIKEAHKLTDVNHIVCGCGNVGCIFISAHKSDIE